ncbi:MULTISPECIES: hypothetical protein [unclassified Streptomyces]|uniref:hypothetical protein n=1 Tax=unclassified Streptomyces TaxID=2593676 RepID=UPI002E2E875F|nr:hypothetical protein [Streptomyces sp. NBC_00228]
MSNRIETFIEWVNAHAKSRGLQADAIPADPHRRVGTGRFRRTLAWHNARRPAGNGGAGGSVRAHAHADQRRLRTALAGRQPRPSRLRNRRNVAEQLREVHESIQDGARVSDPAARCLINAAAQEHHRFSGLIASNQAKDLLADPTLNVFENREAFLFCNCDRTKALCHPGRNAKSEAPSLDRCKVNCANNTRSDRHINSEKQPMTWAARPLLVRFPNHWPASCWNGPRT